MVAAASPIAGSDARDWCLLDRDDATSAARLAARGWTRVMIEDAIADARALRGQIDRVIDTSRTTPAAAAAEVERWLLERHSG